MPEPLKQAEQKETERKYILLGLRITGEFGAIIAAPVVFLAWLGKTLDERYGTGPLLLIAGFVLAFVISAVSITRRAKEFGREYEAIGRKETKGGPK